MTAPEPGELTALIASMDALSSEVVGLKRAAVAKAKADADATVAIAEQNEKRDRRITWSRWAIAAAILVAVASLLIGAGALRTGQDAKATADDILAARKDARLVVCQKDNEDTGKQHALWQGIFALPRAEGSQPTDPAVLAAFNALLADTFPTRDCSPAGIDAYYQGR